MAAIKSEENNLPKNKAGTLIDKQQVRSLLYRIDSDISSIGQIADAVSGDMEPAEVAQMIADSIESLDVDQMVEQLGIIHQQLQDDVKQRTARSTSLQKKSRPDKALMEIVQEQIITIMLAAGRKRAGGALMKKTLVKKENDQFVAVLDEKLIPDEFFDKETVVVKTLNMDRLNKAVLEEGKKVRGCEKDRKRPTLRNI